jgi:hypothetical protein
MDMLLEALLQSTASNIRNSVLRRIFGSMRDEVTGEWRKLNNEELNDLYSSPNTVRVIKSRKTRSAGHVTRTVERRGVYRILVGKLEGRRTLGRPMRRWEDNTKMNLTGFGGLEVSTLAFGTQVYRSRRIFQGGKHPQHSFFRRGSKAVCLMLQICVM